MNRRNTYDYLLHALVGMVAFIGAGALELVFLVNLTNFQKVQNGHLSQQLRLV